MKDQEPVKILFITQEIDPYIKETEIADICRKYPQYTQEKGCEIRTFMPCFGHINERRNQLHEVQRLSGMNIIIDDSDHPLIIKVATIQSTRMQVYFIENDDYFHNRLMITDENGKEYDDNDERTIFFNLGVIEAVKKQRWCPEIIHCNGWMSALIPIYIKKVFKDNPLFSESKIVFSIYDDDFSETFKDGFDKKMKLQGIAPKDVKFLKDTDYVNLMKTALDFSDGIIFGSEKINPELEEYAKSLKKPILEYQSPETYVDAYNDFYDNLK